MADKITKV